MKKLLPISLTIFTLLFFYSLTLITYPVLAVVDPECKPDKVSSERDPRPAPCNVCNTTDLLTPSCATSFEIFDKVEYNPIKEGPMVKKDWEGTITVNPEEIKIPFVGMKNKDSVAWWEISNASENEYLADYFEGTNEYYRNYGNQTTITNYQGVLRKLTPFEYQNQLKKNLISRIGSGEENQIHDYTIKYIGRLCWDTPFWIDAGHQIAEWLMNKVVERPINKTLIVFNKIKKFLTGQEQEELKLQLSLPDIGHYCLYASQQEGKFGWVIVKGNNFLGSIPGVGDFKDFLFALSKKIPGLIHIYDAESVESSLSGLKAHLPPNPKDENYQEKFLIWKNEDGGKWYRLWQATPMLSREDTQGEISPYLAKEHKEDTDLEFTSEEAKLESVPHLARLYEGSQIISNLLTPAGEKKIEMVKSEEIPETTPPNTCFKENYLPGNNEGDTLCCEPIKATFKAVEEFENPDYQKCQEELNKVKTPLATVKTLIDEGFSEAKEALKTTLSEECFKDREKEVSRGIGVNLKHPYLDEIWSYTANANGGFFNIFRPYGVPPFEDIAVAQTVKYSYDPGGFTSNGEASPQEGLFFFPHLGGVQKAKEYVVNQALWPYEEKK